MHATPAKETTWWRGRRGEWLVLIQVLLMALVFFGPRTLLGQPNPDVSFSPAWRAFGMVLMVLGGGFLAASIIVLRRSLTPLPYPREGGTLVKSGPFGLVRHPMYAGGFVLALGYAIFVHSWLTLGYAVALFAFMDFKSRREERWLVERFPEYSMYQRKVRRLIPFLY